MKNFSLSLIIIGIVLFTFNGMGQKSADREDQLNDRALLRKKMHERMRAKLFFDQEDDEWFKQMDRMMDQTIREMDQLFKDQEKSSLFKMATPGLSSFESHWEESKLGRTLKVKPADPKQELDIEVTNGFVTIKGQQDKVSDQSAHSRSAFRSSFSSSLSIPQDCDESKVKIEAINGELVVFFPYKESKVKKSLSTPPDRMPIPSDKSDIEI